MKEKPKFINVQQTYNIASPAIDEIMPDCNCACPVDGANIEVLDLPNIYSLELTPACNNRCPGCSNVFFDDTARRKMILARPPLALDRWRDVLDIIAPYATRLKITGGEPTLHPDFPAIIEAIEQRGLAFTLFTNGCWRNPAQIVNLLKSKQTCAGLLVSLHGATAAAHEAFSGVKGSFDNTLANIKTAASAGLNVHLSCVLTEQNAEQIDDLINLSKQLGAGGVVFNRYIGAPIAGIAAAPEQLAKAITQIETFRRAGETVRFGTCIPQCFIESSSTGCVAGTAYCTIDPWGNMRPCNHTPWLAGNILTSSLHEVWHSEVMKKWRSIIPAACTTCALFAKCHGGCRADAVLNDAEQDSLAVTPIYLDSVDGLASELQMKA